MDVKQQHNNNITEYLVLKIRYLWIVVQKGFNFSSSRFKIGSCS